MYNHAMVNPAAAGECELMQTSLLQRLQWIGVKNAPVTTVVSAHTPMTIGATQHGIGIGLLSDVFGIFANQQINFQYAYRRKFDEGVLSVGTNVGFVNIICYGDSVHMVESEYHSENDILLPMGTQSGVKFDMGLGAQYTAERWHTGLAISHLLAPKVELGERASFKIRQYMVAYGGYDFGFVDPNFKLKTSLLWASDFRSWTFHGALILNYKEKFWGGLGYRLEDAVSVMLGMEIFKGFNMGYTFDLPTNVYLVNSFGSHEFFISYEFSFLVRKKDRSYKSIRIL
jgi:type IX secretion system PorP/SprF family membrane protein